MTVPERLPQTDEEVSAYVSTWADDDLVTYLDGNDPPPMTMLRLAGELTPTSAYFKVRRSRVRAELDKRAGHVLSDHEITARRASDAQLGEMLTKTEWCIGQASRHHNAAIHAEGVRVRGVIVGEIARRQLLSGEAGPAV